MEQIDLFSFSAPKYKIEKPIRLIELFSGLGSQASALDRIGANYTHWLACDNDRFVMASYNAIHGTSFPVTDICQLKAEDLKITERERVIPISLPIHFPARICLNAERWMEWKKVATQEVDCFGRLRDYWMSARVTFRTSS